MVSSNPVASTLLARAGDVVAQQPSPSPLEAVAASLGSPSITSSDRDIKAWQKLVSASAGAMLTTLTTTPLEVVKTRMQTFLPGSTNSGTTSQRTRLSTFRTAMDVVRREGALSLWSGVKPALLMQIPSTVLYYTAYDELKWSLERAGGGPDAPSWLSTYAPLVSGIVSRSAAVTAVAPLELLRTMAMYRQSSVSAGLLGTMRAEVAGGGWTSLWRGWGPTLLRDVPFSGIYWLGYERAKRALYPHISTALGGPGAGTAWLGSFVSGLAAGSVAALLTTPFDVVKTRKQVQLYEEVRSRLKDTGGGGGKGGASGGLCSGPAGQSRATSLGVLRTIAAEEGLGGLFAGVGVRVARVGPACAIMISAYELGKWFFFTKEEGRGAPGNGSDRAGGAAVGLAPPEAVEAAGD